MPRAETSIAGRILGYFKHMPLDTVEVILDLAKEAVRERRLAEQAQPAAPPAPAPVQAAAPKKAAAKKKKKKPAPSAALPTEGPDTSEAGDAPVQ